MTMRGRLVLWVFCAMASAAAAEISYELTKIAEGPAWEGWSLTFAARRSYIDAILPAVLPEDGTLKFTTAP
ncbi:hypothetical protein MK163_07665, partial [bacterium]|nr:hypothetical protein [bacterium]